MLPMLTLWTDVLAVPGTCTTGRKIARLPRRQSQLGQAPAGLDVIHSPTRFVTFIGRTQTNVPHEVYKSASVKRPIRCGVTCFCRLSAVLRAIRAF